MNRILLLLLFALIFNSCKETEKIELTEEPRPIAEVFGEFYEFKKSINPIEATKAGYSKYNDTIANYISDDYIFHLKDRYTYFLEELDKYDSTKVSTADWMSLRVMKWDCSVKLQGVMNPIVTVASPIYDLPSFELMPLFQIQSLHLYVAQLAGGTSVQPFKAIEDYNNWLSRLDDYLIFLDTSIDKMKVGMEKGVVLPRVLTLKMLPQVRAFIDIPLKENLFYQPILNFPDGISDVDKDILESNYAAFIKDKLTPKYVELNKFLTEEYLPKCRETSGLLDLPNGKETYQYLIKLHTTTTMNADEIHELGLSEVARISSEMEIVKNQIGFKGNLKSFFNSLRTRKELMPFNNPEEVIANFNAINDRIALRIDSLFELTPKAGFNVRRTEAFREASASAEYTPGSKDGDPYQYFGMLSMEMHRAIRLVVDTGLHAKGWSREQAIRYSLDNEAESEESIIAEVERYMATPGQALSYKLGQLKIRELRTKAEKALGANFNIREFHSQILNSGSLPLVLLEEKLDGWIASQSK